MPKIRRAGLYVIKYQNTCVFSFAAIPLKKDWNILNPWFYPKVVIFEEKLLKRPICCITLVLAGLLFPIEVWSLKCLGISWYRTLMRLRKLKSYGSFNFTALISGVYWENRIWINQRQWRKWCIAYQFHSNKVNDHWYGVVKHWTTTASLERHLIQHDNGIFDALREFQCGRLCKRKYFFWLFTVRWGAWTVRKMKWCEHLRYIITIIASDLAFTSHPFLWTTLRRSQSIDGLGWRGL